jgi:hypothetical protein
MREPVRVHLSALIFICMIALGAAVEATEPIHREIQMAVYAGVVIPPGEWEHDLDLGKAAGLQMGVGVTPKLTCGLYFTYARFKAKREFLPPSKLNVGDNDWEGYSGGLFTEYSVTKGRLIPFLGILIGIHGIYIEYADRWKAPDGQGSFAFCYGLTSGLRYRQGRHLGAALHVLAENSFGREWDWFVQARVGACLFL